MSNTTRRLTIEFIKDWLKENAPGTILLSTEYKNNKQQLEFKCKCGTIFYKTWTTMQSCGTCMCRSCTKKQGWVFNRRKLGFSQEFKEEFLQKGFTPLEIILRSKDKILCENKEGYKGRISLENVRLGKTFSVFSPVFNSEWLLYNINLYLRKHNSETKALSFEYRKPGYSTKIKCQCECGIIFEVNLTNILEENNFKCSRCNKSQSNIEFLAEQEIKKYVTYQKQKRFKDCRNPLTNYPLSFDFYIPSKNILIEIDGAQHDKPVKFKNCSDEKALEEFEYRKFLDNIKNQYCKDNGFTLIRIKESCFIKGSNEYKRIIQNLFQ